MFWTLWTFLNPTQILKACSGSCFPYFCSTGSSSALRWSILSQVLCQQREKWTNCSLFFQQNSEHWHNDPRFTECKEIFKGKRKAYKENGPGSTGGFPVIPRFDKEGYNFPDLSGQSSVDTRKPQHEELFMFKQFASRRGCENAKIRVTEKHCTNWCVGLSGFISQQICKNFCCIWKFPGRAVFLMKIKLRRNGKNFCLKNAKTINKKPEQKMKTKMCFETETDTKGPNCTPSWCQGFFSQHLPKPFSLS